MFEGEIEVQGVEECERRDFERRVDAQRWAVLRISETPGAAAVIWEVVDPDGDEERTISSQRLEGEKRISCRVKRETSSWSSRILGESKQLDRPASSDQIYQVLKAAGDVLPRRPRLRVPIERLTPGQYPQGNVQQRQSLQDLRLKAHSFASIHCIREFQQNPPIRTVLRQSVLRVVGNTHLLLSVSSDQVEVAG